MFGNLPSILLLIFGFGFVIFWHELGHFLAAKWVGIRVEQFAVGFGQALLSFRKGMGWQLGSSGRKFEDLVANGKAAELGETEYRLNWIPLGGYVKMLGQDDMKPNAEQNDPRAYNRKSIGARMVVVSAGVIMNIILAAIAFMFVFRMGLNVSPSVVGGVYAGSPAAKTTRLDGTRAPLQVGDRILMFDDQWQHSFDKIQLNVALSREGKLPLYVRRADGSEERLLIQPEKSPNEPSDFLLIGVQGLPELRGFDPKKVEENEILATGTPEKYVMAEALAVKPGEVITQINGENVISAAAGQKDQHGALKDEYWKLDRALHEAAGKPITITVADVNGKTRQEQVRPRFASTFAGSLDLAGMVPRAMVEALQIKNAALDQLFPGDAIVRMEFANGGDGIDNPTSEEVRARLEKAGTTQQPIDFVVLRGDKLVEVKGLVPKIKIPGRRGVYGLNVGLGIDENNAVVAQTLDKSPAQAAGIPVGASITAIDGQPVKSWFDVKQLLSKASPDKPVKISADTANGAKEYTLNLNKEQIDAVAGLRYTHSLSLREHVEPRKTDKLSVAAAWGVTETRDFILQFYVTLHRMFTGRVSYKNVMGPLGIFNAGRHFAYKGTDWLIWFLAMISANLAVVNFLPIPIVDGGLFTFLIVEKIQGRPLSPKTQSIAQFVGLAVILSVFLLVTYQDIARMFF